MTLRRTVYVDFVCDDCGFDEYVGCGLDESSVLPLPDGWEETPGGSHWCPACAATSVEPTEVAAS